MKNQPVITHHRLQSIGDLLVAMQCHPLDVISIEEIHVSWGLSLLSYAQ